MTEPGTEVELARTTRTTPDVDSWVPVIGQVVKLSEHVADTEFVPGGLRGNPPAIAAAILHGRELGLPPMTALAQTHVIDGRPSLSAEGQRGLVLAAGHEIEWVEMSDASVTVRGRRAGADRWQSVTWTLDRARRAGIAGKKNWQGYPRAMLAARASAELCRLVFPDVVHGMMAAEELADSDGAEPAAKSPTRAVQRQAPPPVDIPTPEPERPAERPTAPPPPEAPPEPEPPDEPVSDPPVTPAQLKMLGVVWNKFGATDVQRREITARIVGRDLYGTTRNLTKTEAIAVINDLTRILRNLAAPDDTMAEHIDQDAARTALAEWLAERESLRNEPEA